MINMITVIVPVFNEERSVAETLKSVKEVMAKCGVSYEIIAVNDGSKDGSAEQANSVPGVRIISHPYNLGYGASLKSGIKVAKGEYILITDADGTYPINDIPVLLEHADKYDMVVGARVKKNIPLLRKPAKWFLGCLANFLTGRKIADLNSGFRIFRKEIALEFFHLFPSGFSFTTTITLACMTNDYTVKYVPINYFKRKGKSTIHPLKDFVGFTALIFRIVTYFRPFRMFSSIGFFLLLIAFFVFLYTKFVLDRVMDIAVIVIALSSLQIFLFGMLAELVLKSRK